MPLVFLQARYGQKQRSRAHTVPRAYAGTGRIGAQRVGFRADGRDDRVRTLVKALKAALHPVCGK